MKRWTPSSSTSEEVWKNLYRQPVGKCKMSRFFKRPRLLLTPSPEAMNPHLSIDQYCRTAKFYSMDMHWICGYEEVERVWLENECIVYWSCVFNNGAPNSFASSSLAIPDEQILFFFDDPPDEFFFFVLHRAPRMINGQLLSPTKLVSFQH